MVVKLFFNLFTALVSYVPNMFTFWVLNLFLRMIQGFGNTTTLILVAGLISDEFKEKATVYLGARDVAWAFGSMLGPGLVFLITDTLHFAGIFFFFSCFIAIFGLIPALMLPSRLSQKLVE